MEPPSIKSFRLALPEPIGAELRRIVAAQFTLAIRRTAPGGDRSNAQRVHDGRTAAKKIRAALRLLKTYGRTEYSKTESALRAAARELSSLRDAQVLLESFDRLLAADGGEMVVAGLRPLRRALAARQLEGGRQAAPALARFAREMRAEKSRFARVPTPAGDWGMIEPDLLRAYRRARRAYRRADGSRDSALFHRWRKAVKILGYHHQLLRAGWPPVMKALRRQHDKLSDLLGDEHDLALLREYIASADPAKIPRTPAATALMARADARRRELQTAARLEGSRLFDQKPRVWVKRLARWWTIARSEEPL